MARGEADWSWKYIEYGIGEEHIPPTIDVRFITVPVTGGRLQ